ncbi:MAG: thioredoxin family protein [Candidatus Woesearchaeota archaeon]|jgi:small redox-active disulfide protein 2
MKIEILGMGCSKCKKLEENAKKAVVESGKKIDVIKVTEMEKIIGYGVISTPALVIDGNVKCYGRIADVKEIKGWL